MKKILSTLLLVGLFLSINNKVIAKEKTAIEPLNIEKKYVYVYKHYYNVNYYQIGDLWYDDGVYRGWLYKRNATIVGSFTNGYFVTYKGWVFKGPFLPNNFLLEK